MKFSIIIAVYNAERYLGNLLDSILDQTYKNFEIVLVDDGSSDKSYNIMKKYAKKDKRIKIYHKNNEGPGLTRKFGFEHSVGDLVFFVDSDDSLPDENVLEKIITIFESNDIDLLMFNSERNPKDAKIHIPFNKKSFKEGKHDVNELDDCIVIGSLCMKVFKYNLFEADFFINANNFEDFFATYKYLNNCRNFYYLNEFLYIVNRLEENKSLTRNMNLQKFINTVDIIIEINRFSNLQNSAKLLALNYYMFAVQMLVKSKESFKVKVNLIKKLKKLRKLFNDEAIVLCKKKFKKKALILYYISRIFI